MVETRLAGSAYLRTIILKTKAINSNSLAPAATKMKKLSSMIHLILNPRLRTPSEKLPTLLEEEVKEDHQEEEVVNCLSKPNAISLASIHPLPR